VTSPKSASQIDLLRENQLQSSIFQPADAANQTMDFSLLRDALERAGDIPDATTTRVLGLIQDHAEKLGVRQPSSGLIIQWVAELLAQEGYTLGEAAFQSLELSLSDVENQIYHPLGFGAGANQNPEATSLRLAQHVKGQFAAKRVFHGAVIDAHEAGRIDLAHLGAIDRIHDIFLTPDYLKGQGLPVTSGAPHAGPAKTADVLLAHLVRFTHELQNYFAGDIQWGYVNTLLTPYLEKHSDRQLRQFVQQMLFELSQLEAERGGLYRKVTLDFDFDMPRQLSGLPALGPCGVETGKTYRDYRRTLERFNEVALDLLESGDYRGSPFQNPRIVYHFNDPKTPWDGRRQKLMNLAFRFGNPVVAFSFYRRDFGPLGQLALNDPDFLKSAQNPSQLRGFSSSSAAINLPRLVQSGPGDFQANLEETLDLVVAAHRQKRRFVSRLMAYGPRGPLQFLRHKLNGQSFLKIDSASQPLQVIGLGEAAALRNGSPLSPPEALGAAAETIMSALNAALARLNRAHKLRMFTAGARSDTAAYRLAHLDMREFGQAYAPYLFHDADQAHPIYTEGPNILAFAKLRWRDRFAIEGRLHRLFGGHHEAAVFIRNGALEDPALHHIIYAGAQAAGIGQLQMAPDLQICMACFFVFAPGAVEEAACPHCGEGDLSPYGYCQGNFSPVRAWCLGKRAEWKIRRRIDKYREPVQTQFHFEI